MAHWRGMGCSSGLNIYRRSDLELGYHNSGV